MKKLYFYKKKKKKENNTGYQVPNLLDDGVISQSSSSLVEFSKASLVNEFFNTLQVRIAERIRSEKQDELILISRKSKDEKERRCKRNIPICNIRLHSVQHVQCCLVHFQKDTIENL